MLLLRARAQAGGITSMRPHAIPILMVTQHSFFQSSNLLVRLS
jgi:hypothetical protein